MEKTPYVVTGKQDTFEKVWGPFGDIVEQSDADEILLGVYVVVREV